MNPSTPHPQPEQARECPRCRGLGAVVARSRSVGGGCVNDDWDDCPICHGNGTITTPTPASAEGRVVILLALVDALRTAVTATLKHGPGADAGRLETATKALLAHGRTPQEVQAHIDAITEGWRSARAPKLPVGVTALELEVEQRR